MASETTNLHLTKPAETDAVDVTQLNDNADKIDTAYAALAASLAGKVDKVTGKGLSTNDFTNAYKGQVDKNKAGIGAAANYGSKNRFKWSLTSGTNHGVKYTVLNDGGIKIENGTGTRDANLDLYLLGAWGDRTQLEDFNDQNYTASLSGSTTTTKIYIRIRDNSVSPALQTTCTLGNSTTFKQLYTVIMITIDKTLTIPEEGITFYPMIRPATIEDDTFVQYAPSNRELYEMILALSS